MMAHTPRCDKCGRDMRLLVSCRDHGYTLDGKNKDAIAYGSRGEGRNENIELPENCWDCGTPKEGYHHPGCLEERCPADGIPYMVCRHPKDDAVKNRERSWSRAAMNIGYRGMVANPDGAESQADVDKAEKGFEGFHAAPPARMRKVHLPPPPTAAWKLGRLVSLVYEPEAPSKRRNTLFEHKLGDKGLGRLNWDNNKPILAVSADGEQLLIVKDKSRFHTTSRGIIG